jgi:hypothetical protein
MALGRKEKSAGMRQKKSIAVIINGNWGTKGIRNNKRRNHHSTASQVGREGGGGQTENSGTVLPGSTSPGLI